MPEFLYDINHPDAPLDSFPRTPLTTPTPISNSRPTDGSETTTISAGILLTYYIFFRLYNNFTHTENASYYAELEERHKELVGETVEVGLMFASKAFVQLLANPIVGPLTHK